MASRRVSTDKPAAPRRPPATTPESRENQLVALAVDLAEQQMREGTASAQVVTHFLKLGSSREFLEQQRIAMEVTLLEAKRDSMASAARVEELYEKAIAAMREYGGHEAVEHDVEGEY